MAIAQRRMTLKEFLALPEEEPPLEYVDHEVIQKVSPQGQHARLQLLLGMRLVEVAEPRRLAMVFTELRSTYHGESHIPDISVYRWDRVPRLKDGRIANRFTKPPDVAIEIASPDQRITAMVRRCLWYVEHGSEIALLLDPADESVLQFRPGAPAQALVGADRLDLSPILPDFGMTVGAVFALLRPEA